MAADPPPALPPKVADSSKSPDKGKGKDKGVDAKSETPKVTTTGKPLPTFEERQARAAKLTDQQKKDRGASTEAPKEKGSKKSSDSKPKASESSSAKDSTTPKTDGKSDSKEAKNELKPSSTDAKSSTPTTTDDSDPVKLKTKLDAVAAAYDSGDLKAIAKALGKDAKSGDVGGEKFAVMARQRARLTKREQTLDQKAVQLDQREAKLRDEHGDIGALKIAYKSGKYHVAAKFWEKVTGDSFAKTTQLIARHTAGLSPEKVAELEKADATERELRQLRAEKEQGQKKQQTQATRAQAHTTLKTKLAGHAVMKLDGDPDDPDAPDGAELVLREIEREHTRSNTILDLKVAADRVLQRQRRRALALGLKDEPVPPKVDEPDDEDPPVNPGRTPRAESAPAAGARTTLGGKVIPSFEERMARAERLSAQRRGR